MDNKKPRTSWSYYEYVDAYNNLEDENAKLKEENDHLTMLMQDIRNATDSQQSQSLLDLRAENAKLKDRIVEYDEFANERALSDFAKDEEIDKLKALLQDALPHIECKNASQSGLITAIGEALEGDSDVSV